MNVSEIKHCDIANGAGVRVSVFVSGCRHRCRGCYNEAAWGFDAGVPFEDVEERIVNLLGTSFIDGLSVLGGEPLEPENQIVLAPFLERVKGMYPDKDVWMWTGFTYEGLRGSRADTEHLDRILSCVDVLVDGPFVEELRDITLRFRGSSNQRIIKTTSVRLVEATPETPAFRRGEEGVPSDYDKITAC